MGENPAALRAAVFSLASKNLRGGGRSNAPPPQQGAGEVAVTNKMDHLLTNFQKNRTEIC